MRREALKEVMGAWGQNKSREDAKAYKQAISEFADEVGKPGDGKKRAKPASAKKAVGTPPKGTLECWLVKKMLLVENKEEQYRGQEQLREMAEKFKSSNKSLQCNYDIVKWVLEGKNPDQDLRYQWCYVASRVERCETSPWYWNEGAGYDYY